MAMGQEDFESGIEFYEEYVDKILSECPRCKSENSCRYTRSPTHDGDIMRLDCKFCEKHASCGIVWEN